MGSVSSLEGFSPSSHSGETNHHRGWQGSRGGGCEEEAEEGAIPWVLIPITGVCQDVCHVWSLPQTSPACSQDTTGPRRRGAVWRGQNML